MSNFLVLAEDKRRTGILMGGALIVALLIFMVDISLPLGVAGGVPYVAVVLMSLWFPGRRHIVTLAIVTSILTVMGLVFSPEGGVLWVVLFNRGLALFAIWACAVSLLLRKLVQKELRYEKQRVENYLTISETIIVQLDHKHCVEMINQQGCQVLGYTSSELIGRDWMELCIADNQVAELTDVHNAVLIKIDNSVDRFENQIVTKSGEHKYIAWINIPVTDESGTNIGTLSSGQDITVRKKMEQDLRLAHNQLGIQVRDRTEELSKSEARYKAIIESQDEYIIRVNPVGTVTFVNEAFCRFMELTKEELVGQYWHDLLVFAPNRLNNVQATYNPFFGGNYVAKADIQSTRFDGADCWIQWISRPIYDSDGTLTEIQNVGRDITERKHMEQTLLASIDVAEKASKAKSDFLAHMSHEFRTPLNAIIGFSEVMNSEYYGPIGSEKYRDYALDINHSGKHILSLINDILDLSAIEAGKRALVASEVDIPKMLANCIRDVQLAADNKKISLTLDVSTKHQTIYADKRAIYQIVLNLLSNAIKFTDPEGAIQLKLTSMNDRMIFTTVDNGIGIPANMVSKITEPFSQLDMSVLRAQEGTGLGLSIVKSLVEAMDGKLTIQSESGEGTCVTVELPKETEFGEKGEPT